MEITGSHVFRAPAERIHALLRNPDFLATVIPGCERLIQFGPPDASGTTTLEARIRSGEPSTARIMQITLRPDDEAGAVEANLRWREPSAAGNQPETEISCEARLDAQDGATTGAWTVRAEATPESFDEDAVPSFVETLCAHIDAALERQSQQPAQGEISAGNEFFVRTPYGTITMARPEPVWGGWVRTVALTGGIALALGAVIAAAVMITRALSGRRHTQE